ncbi:MAG: VCBS repeat-containing protein [Nitrospirae bacterium]|nr:VCBS repeat-containing protein [Nitrospirota bacterium]MBF0593214.1 VCBS repeat-containing protein [Nitrospirota bacterium]
MFRGNYNQKMKYLQLHAGVRVLFVLMLIVMIGVMCINDAWAGRFTDNGDGSMTDTYTGLQWMKNADGCNGAVTWAQASTCAASGWKLPTIQQLYSLCRTDGTTTGLDAILNTGVGYCNNTSADVVTSLMTSGFTNVQNFYWSSENYASGTSSPWIIAMSLSYVQDGTAYSTSPFGHVWPVRGGTNPTPTPTPTPTATPTPTGGGVKNDFDGDGKGDILLRNTSTGDVYIWLMDGMNTKGGGLVVKGLPLNWVIKGTGDFNGDGKADILLQDTQTGDVVMWLMNGATISSGNYVLKGIPKNWQITEVEDFNGDGKADIMWQDTTTGDVAVWLMNGATISSGNYVLKGIPNWQIQ